MQILTLAPNFRGPADPSDLAFPSPWQQIGFRSWCRFILLFNWFTYSPCSASVVIRSEWI